MKLMFAHALVGAAALLVCAEAQAKEIETLGPIEISALSVTSDDSAGNFMVVDSRMQETSTAAVIGGVIAASINSAINKEEDDRKAQPFLQAAAALDLATLVEAAITETLSKRGVPLSDPGSHQLTIEIKDWGLTRVSYREPQSVVFLKVHVTMKQGRTFVWDTYVKESGVDSALLGSITPEAFTEQTTALAQKTGKRIAYEIIYR